MKAWGRLEWCLYWAILLMLAGAAISGCALGSGARDGAMAAATGGPMPTPPPGMGLWDAIMYSVATAVAYGGVASVRGVIRNKLGVKEEEKA